jgi:hypothetical protein
MARVSRFSLCCGILCLAAAGLVSSCDTSVDLYDLNDRHFSILGFLDASADTQFIRIEHLRDSVAYGSGPLQAEVTLEHLETGEVTVLRDSLAQIFDPVEEEFIPIHKFWVPLRLQPAGRYRLTVTGEGGAASTAAVTLPDSFPDPAFELDPPIACECIRNPNDGDEIHLEIPGISRLAGINAVYETAFGQTFTVIHFDDAVRMPDGYQLSFSYLEDISFFVPPTPEKGRCIRRLAVLIGAAGPEWPENAVTTEFPENYTNIEGGEGFLGGILTKTIEVPLTDCG